MLQIQQLREEKERVVQGLQKKNIANAAEQVENAISIDTERKEIQLLLNKLQEEVNKLS